MKKTVKNRLVTLTIVLGFCCFGISLLLYSMSDNIVFFYSPSEFKESSKNEARIGGVVKNGSILNIAPDVIEFVITDYNSEIRVRYKGIVPVLFRENQGVVVLGKMENGVFIAQNLLTKHDENYKPPIKFAN